MSIVAFTFGSFGDIVTILQLVQSVRKTLDETRGSAAEYRELNDYLGSFQKVVQYIGDLVSTMSPNDGTYLSGKVDIAMKMILQNIAICYRRIESFGEKLEPYAQSFKPGGTGRVFLDSWRKVNWALSSFRDDAASLGNTLKSHLQIINALLLSAHMTKYLEICQFSASTSRVLKDLPAGVYLTDMLDETLLVPMHHCRDNEELHEYLIFLFRKRAGKVFVTERSYTLSAESGQLIRYASWANDVKAGNAILMSALLCLMAAHRCPKCRQENKTSLRSPHGEIRCCYCRTSYKVLDNEQPERFQEVHEYETAETRTPDPSRLEANSESSLINTPDSVASEPAQQVDETHLIQHLSIILRDTSLDSVGPSGTPAGTSLGENEDSEENKGTAQDTGEPVENEHDRDGDDRVTSSASREGEHVFSLLPDPADEESERSQDGKGEHEDALNSAVGVGDNADSNLNTAAGKTRDIVGIGCGIDKVDGQNCEPNGTEDDLKDRRVSQVGDEPTQSTAGNGGQEEETAARDRASEATRHYVGSGETSCMPWRIQMHNLLQRSCGTGVLCWDTYQEPSQHDSPWTAIALVNGVEYGRGTGWQQGEAKEEASRVAYGQLYRALYPGR